MYSDSNLKVTIFTDKGVAEEWPNTLHYGVLPSLWTTRPNRGRQSMNHFRHVAPPRRWAAETPLSPRILTQVLMSRLCIAVTGANKCDPYSFPSRFCGLNLRNSSGVGFGNCQRLLEQLSSEHQTDANPQFDIPVESKDVPDERPQWSGLTLIMVCRNMQKAETARGKLLSYLDQILEARKVKGVPDEYGRNFRQNLIIEIEKCDFTSVKSVVDCARGMRKKSVP